MLPNFLIAGAAKSGSSSLHYYLGQHHDILMSKVKEPAFFTKNWHRGVQWYESFFDHWSGEQAVGEATVEYMVDKEAPERISQTLPDVKLIFIMRNPVDRAWSHYWHRVKMGEERRSFEQIVADGNAEEYPFKYSLYATHIERYLQFFEKSQMMFIFLEDLREDFDDQIRGACQFIGLKDEADIRNEGPKNRAKIYRNAQLSSFAAKIRANDSLKEKFPKKILPAFQFAFRMLDNLNKKPFDIPQLGEKERSQLTEFFSTEIIDLERLTGRHLSHWGQPRSTKVGK